MTLGAGVSRTVRSWETWNRLERSLEVSSKGKSMFGGGSGDGVMVVPAEENGGAFQGGGKVDGSVVIALTGGTLTVVGQRNGLLSHQLVGIGCPSRVGDLCVRLG